MDECPLGLGEYLGSQCRDCEHYREEFAGAILMGFWVSCDYHSSVTRAIDNE